MRYVWITKKSWVGTGFLEDWQCGFLSVKNKELGKITGVKTEEAKIVSCKMWRSQKYKIKCEGSRLKLEDCEADTTWYPL